MTIFFSIAKNMLKDIINDRLKRAEEKDKSKPNQMASSIGFGRKAELSAYKQILLKDLIKKLDEFKEEKNDEATKNTLYKLFENYRTLAKNKAAEFKVYNEGKFGDTMEDCQTISNKLFNRFNEVKLNDKILDNDPLTLFRCCAAEYFSQKISKLPTPKKKKSQGFFSNISNQVKKMTKTVISQNITPLEVSYEKEQLLLKTLSLCEDQLEKLKTDHETYTLNRKERVLEIVNGMLSDNKKLVNDHSTTKIPLSFSGIITVSLDGVRIGPSEGKLYNYLCNLCFELKEQISEYKKTHLNQPLVEKKPEPLRLSQNIAENQKIINNIL